MGTAGPPSHVRDLLLLANVPGVGPQRLKALLQHFQDSSRILQSSARELLRVPGIDRKTAVTIAHFSRSTDYPGACRMADLQGARLGRVNARVVSILDHEYPANLKRIYDPPPFLFVRGSLDGRDAASIAIVGTRSPTPYGIEMAGRFASELVAAGIPVISGLARGIDTVAHRRTVERDGRTLAVIGSGVDAIYPPENFRLAEHIIAHGAVLSEFDMGAKPDAGNFPRRNRIISGIALATVIIETGVDGGAMITAGTALDQNRDVFAVPGAVRAGFRSGTHLLIRKGNALLVESVQEVLEDLAPRLRGFVPATSVPPPLPAPTLSLFERHLYDVVGESPAHIDQVAELAGCTSADALVHLLSLEFKGVVRQLPGKMFARI